MPRLNLKFGPVAGAGPGGFEPWVQALVGEFGCYVIRSRSTGEVLYVGESHKNGRLYDTLTRHFQSWSGARSGLTYDRHRVEVAVVLTDTGDEALAVEEQLIEQLDPRDNERRLPVADEDELAGEDVAGDDAIEGVPF